MRQFGRQIRLWLGNDSESIVIDNLRISFTVEKSLTAEPNAGEINVYNLTRSNQNLLVSKVYNKAVLMVGYEEPRVIYGGDIIKAVVIRDDLDYIVKLDLGDGQNDIIGARVNTTLKAGATDEDIAKEAVKAMKGSEEGVIDVPIKKGLPRGKVLVGNARDVLNKIAKNQKADWSIQDGEVIVLPKDKILSDNEGFVLSQDTGMIGSPQKTADGLEVDCLINPALVIGALVRIQSIDVGFNGDYKITSLIHEGDNYADEWYSKIICIGGEFQKVEKGKKDGDKKG